MNEPVKSGKYVNARNVVFKILLPVFILGLAAAQTLKNQVSQYGTLLLGGALIIFVIVIITVSVLTYASYRKSRDKKPLPKHLGPDQYL